MLIYYIKLITICTSNYVKLVRQLANIEGNCKTVLRCITNKIVLIVLVYSMVKHLFLTLDHTIIITKTI